MRRGFGVTVFGASMVCAVHAQLQAQPQAQSQGQSQTQTPSTPHSPSSSPHSVEVQVQAGERLSESLLRAVGPLAEGSAVHWLYTHPTLPTKKEVVKSGVPFHAKKQTSRTIGAG